VPAVLAVVLALCAALGACGGGGGPGGGAVELRFSWWGNPDRAARTQDAVDLFEERHPGIEISVTYSGYDTYIQKLATQSAGGDAPDVMQLDYRQITQYAQSGILLDLGRRPRIGTADIDRGLLATGVVDGVQYAIPMARGTQAIPYDAVLWERSGLAEPTLGWTWEDWADAMRHLSEVTPGDYVGGVDPGWSEDAFEVWLRGQGKSLYTDDGGLGFTADDLTRWWEWCTGLREEGAVSSAEQTTQLDGSVENQPMGRHQAVSDMNWDAPSSGYEALIGADRLKLAPMPSGEDGTPGQYYKPSMFIGAAADTAHPEEAARFIDFFLNDPEAGRILGATRGMPVNTRIREDVLPALEGFDQVVSDYQRQFEGRLNAPPPAPPPGDASLQRTFQRDYDLVSYGILSPREAAENYITEAEAELRQ
jgi:multiple sugar transport system substrate-binding protein